MAKLKTVDKVNNIFLLIFFPFLILISILFGYFAYPFFNQQISCPQNSPASSFNLNDLPIPSVEPEEKKFSPIPSVQEEVDVAGFYRGQISPRVPYKGLEFYEIDVHNFSPLVGQLEVTDYHYGGSVFDGYTFVANEREDFEFVAEEDRNSNPASFINTELYGWGPTVIKMDTVIGWGVPATTRYFYVVKGSDFYGPNYVVPDGSGKTYDGSKYGSYTLRITQRE